MPGFNQSPLNYKARNTNSVTITIGDTVVAFGQTVTPSFDFGTTLLYGIGTNMPQDNQQLRTSPSISIDEFQLTEDGMVYFGSPQSIGYVLNGNSFDITIYGSKGEIINSFITCVASSYNGNLPANQPITETITFLAMDVLGPNGQSVLSQVTPG